MIVSTYTAKATSESRGFSRTLPSLQLTASGSGTGSGSTQANANLAAEEAAKRASRTALDTEQNIMNQLWNNLTTGFVKEFPLEDIEYYITFDPHYISYANSDGRRGTTTGIFWETVFSGEAYKVNIPPADPHFVAIGTNCGNISAFISVNGSVQDGYNFNITVDNTIHSEMGGLFIDKIYNFSSKMTWVGTFTCTTTITTGNIGSIVLDILNDDADLEFEYDSSKTDITLNAPGLVLSGNVGFGAIEGEKKKTVLNGAYEFTPVHAVGLNTSLPVLEHPQVYRVMSNFDRSFVATAPAFDVAAGLDQFVAEDKVVVTALGAHAKK
jgi:hypothetical protein